MLLSCSYRQTDLAALLLEVGADPTIFDEIGYSCVFAAVDGRCSIATLQALMDHGAHIDTKRKDGTNALLCACRTGQSESVRFLLEAGADVNVAKPDGNTSLHVAVCGHCDKEALQKIIQHGVNVNAVNNNCETALVRACSSAQAEAVKVLLESGADPNISNCEDYTSLHAAVYGCCTNETQQGTITCKVQLDAQNINGETALVLACLYQQQSSVKILLEAGSNPNIASTVGNTSLHAAVLGNCSQKTIKAIIDHGADINTKSKHRRTALLIACQKANMYTISVLLKAGANPNITDAKGDTCLMCAVTSDCSREVLQAMIDRGADVNAANKCSVTVLMKACHKKNTGAINALLSAGADANIADAESYACLHYAVYEGCSKKVFQEII